jgi:lipid II:glycine glycyltransferase (peptidoglycan interpeptide bridge formation enzyme)
VPLSGWSLAYAPRGPIGALDDPAVRDALIEALGATAENERIGRVRADPETTERDPFGAALLQPPWRAAPKVQPPMTRLIDLTADEASLWSALGKKHRQYVSKAGREGVTIERIDVDGGADATNAALADFDRIYRHTGDRAGFAVRVPTYYRRVWDAFAADGRARLSFAVRDGERVATIFHLICGDRVAEVYGGMTEAGAGSRANYLLKWEAIRSSREQGATSYDLWGLATGGIAHFKTGFGGREVRYIGAWDLVLNSFVRAVYQGAGRARVWWARRRHGVGGSGSASAFGGAEGAE